MWKLLFWESLQKLVEGSNPATTGRQLVFLSIKIENREKQLVLFVQKW